MDTSEFRSCLYLLLKKPMIDYLEEWDLEFLTDMKKRIDNEISPKQKACLEKVIRKYLRRKI